MLYDTTFSVVLVDPICAIVSQGIAVIYSGVRHFLTN